MILANHLLIVNNPFSYDAVLLDID